MSLRLQGKITKNKKPQLTKIQTVM